jgi:hypothetical protein
MAHGKKEISEKAVERLEEKGYLMSIRAEMKAEVMKCLVEMEEAGEIPPHLRIKRFSPPDDLNKEMLGYVLQFLRFHQMTNAVECLVREVNGRITVPQSSDGNSSLVAQAVRQNWPGLVDRRA